MISARVVLATCCVVLVSCAQRVPSSRTGAVSSDAPSWARSGDQKSDDGSLFVCEGTGPDEAQAYDAARALCSAKICEVCGVEVKSTVQTNETLKGVDVQRKVVETCRRVRKAEEDVRYRQAGCGPDGCTAWLQVFFGKEAEARECRAYADGNFADSGQCEQLIEQFRRTPDLTAESFHSRVDLLTRAIVACAEIDVRPTPKLTALDEILWQGVVSPHAEPRARRPVEKSQPILERMKAQAANRTDAWKTETADGAYKAIDRQPLIESKIFVDRIATIRDAMVGYESVMTALEARADLVQTPDEPHAAALIRALRALKPVASWTPERILDWTADELSRERDVLRLASIEQYFMEKYETPFSHVGDALRRAMRSDGKASEPEWRFTIDRMVGCTRCAAELLDLPEHGGEPTRVARLVEISRLVSTSDQLKALQEIDPAFLLRAEPALDAKVASALFSYGWFRRFLVALPTFARDKSTRNLGSSWTTDSCDWRWPVTPAVHKTLAARAWQLFQAASFKCDDLGAELSLFDTHGVDTRAAEAVVCRCVSEPRHDGMRDVTELYQRLVAWGASCVAKEGT